MDDHALWIRNHVYRRFVELGRAPTLAELQDDLGDEAEPALRRLHGAHAQRAPSPTSTSSTSRCRAAHWWDDIVFT
jgi:hypothetical protein